MMNAPSFHVRPSQGFGTVWQRRRRRRHPALSEKLIRFPLRGRGSLGLKAGITLRWAAGSGTFVREPGVPTPS